jgi:uncharacterized protein (TIGR03435 family)
MRLMLRAVSYRAATVKERYSKVLPALVTGCAAVSAVAMLYAQSPRFDAVSIKPSSEDKKVATTRIWGDTSDRVTLRHIPLKYVLMHVYNLESNQIIGPEWLSTDVWDILAVVPPGTPKEQVPLMFGTLLADRFKLKFHREMRTERVYALVVAKSGPKLKEAVPYDAAAYKDAIRMSGSGEDRTGSVTANGLFGPVKSTITGAVKHTEFASISTNNLAKFLSQGQLDLPVVDMTELTGSYQVSLDMGVGPAPSLSDSPDPAAGSILESLHKLGLNLERRNETVEKFIVDSGDRVPTEN